MTSPVAAAPGVILAVWSSSGFGGTMIRLGAVLRGRPGVANHVIVITHQDAKGRWIGIEGKPGGVGLTECTRWLADSRTRGNGEQVAAMEKADTAWPAKRDTFLASAAKTLGVGYDWVGIAEDTLQALHLEDVRAQIDHLWRWPSKPGQLPGHVVCSSLAAVLYASAGWPHPRLGEERECTPAGWWDWSDRRLWTAGAPGQQ